MGCSKAGCQGLTPEQCTWILWGWELDICMLLNCPGEYNAQPRWRIEVEDFCARAISTWNICSGKVIDISHDPIVACLLHLWRCLLWRILVSSVYVSKRNNRRLSKETLNQQGWKTGLRCIHFNTPSPQWHLHLLPNSWKHVNIHGTPSLQR